MTTRPTDEEIREMADHMQSLCDFPDVAAMLRAWLTERQTARDGVPDELPNPDPTCINFELELAYMEGWNACREAMLSTSPKSQQAVPDGWKLVPIDATQDMASEGYKKLPRRMYGDVEMWDIDPIWDAMLSSAPAYNGKKEEQ